MAFTGQAIQAHPGHLKLAPTSPATSIDPLVRNYLQNLVLQVELMRRSMQNAMIPVPPPLSTPPWYPTTQEN